jgi:hypothetical protein
VQKLLDINSLKNIVHRPGLSNTEKLLLCMSLGENKPKSVAEIKSIAQSIGLAKARNWNVSQYLATSKAAAIRTDKGWELTEQGRRQVTELASMLANAPVQKIASTLRSHLSGITDSDTNIFVEEAIRCYELKLYRAAVVLSWVGSVSLLYDYIIKNKLAEFNAEAKKRDAKWHDAKTKDDLAKMKEHGFLQVLVNISVIGKSIKDELEGCLKLRNGCGHPNSLKIGEHRVSAHLESLILNIFSVF